MTGKDEEELGRRTERALQALRRQGRLPEGQWLPGMHGMLGDSFAQVQGFTVGSDAMNQTPRRLVIAYKGKTQIIDDDWLTIPAMGNPLTVYGVFLLLQEAADDPGLHLQPCISGWVVCDRQGDAYAGSGEDVGWAVLEALERLAQEGQ